MDNHESRLTELEREHDASQLGDCQLLAIVIKDLLPLSDDARRAALDEFDVGAYNRRLIWEALRPSVATTPSWQWAGEIADQSATNVRALDMARRKKP